MNLFSIELTPAGNRFDFSLYAVTVLGLGAFLMLSGSADQQVESLGWVVLGLFVWSALEYLLHRFVLHGLEPFKDWHQMHHQRQAALIGAPTSLSATLMALLVFVPAWALADVRIASALTLGVAAGYLGYALTHHAIHHWRGESAWLLRRKRWHALHHRYFDRNGRYGVTNSVWDLVFGTSKPALRHVAPDSTSRDPLGPDSSIPEPNKTLPRN